MKRSQPRRNWKDAESQRGPCLVCGRTDRVELAHLTERANDKFYALDEPFHVHAARVNAERSTLRVSPLRVVPLCGPATDPTTCHGKYDGHRLDITSFLPDEKAAQAVLDVGFETARIRLTGSRRSA